jgi:catechol 2,3-dioxygenase-like lactoylglutathione lyase family enzyme
MAGEHVRTTVWPGTAYPLGATYDGAGTNFSVFSQMEAFLNDFGMVRAARDETTLYMRGEGSDPFLHVTHKGEPGFAGVAFRALSVADLEKLAGKAGAKVEALEGPGGGKVVRLKDPDGFSVEAVAGREAAPVVEPPAGPVMNDSRAHPRSNAPKRVRQGASHIRRLGHCVLNVSNFRASEAWYKEHFGFITSDEIKMSPEFSLGAFMRCDRGDKPADHHTLFLLGTDRLGRDMFSRLAYGTRISLTIGLIGVTIKFVLGIVLGVIIGVLPGLGGANGVASGGARGNARRKAGTRDLRAWRSTCPPGP